MKFNKRIPPRQFSVGKPKNNIKIKDIGSLSLDNDEQVTLLTSDSKEYDIAKKNWGFYATPSVNGRLAVQGFDTALVENSTGKQYVMIIEKEKHSEFSAYCACEELRIVMWLHKG